MKRFLTYCCVFVGLLAGYLLFQFVSCLLPNSCIHSHIAESVVELAVSGDYPNALIEDDNCKMDNFTDAIILSMAYHTNSKTHKQLTQSMFCPQYTKADSSMIINLYGIVTYNLPPNMDYARYWHGSTFLMRYLLMFFDYNHIRYMLYMVTTLLMILVCYRLSNRLLMNNDQGLALIKTLGFISGFLLLNGVITLFSIQYAPVVILSFMTTLLVCKHIDNNRRLMMLLFVTGSLTSFFDLLTTPLLTLGLPLLAYALLKSQKDYNMFSEYKSLTYYSLIWLIGFAATWASKWVLATLFTPNNIIKDAFSSIHERSSATDFSRLDALWANITMMPCMAVILVLTLLIILSLLFYKNNEAKNFLLFLPFILAPYVWYFCLANHSYLHKWFTYRVQIIAVSAFVLTLCNMIDWQKIKNIPFKKINKQYCDE